MSSRTYAADEYLVIRDRLRDLQYQRDYDIECFLHHNGHWYHRGLNETGRFLLVHTYKPIETTDPRLREWHGGPRRIDTARSDVGDLRLLVLDRAPEFICGSVSYTCGRRGPAA